jgi:hypothetical protein
MLVRTKEEDHWGEINRCVPCETVVIVETHDCSLTLKLDEVEQIAKHLPAMRGAREAALGDSLAGVTV